MRKWKIQNHKEACSIYPKPIQRDTNKNDKTKRPNKPAPILTKHKCPVRYTVHN